MSLVLLLFFFKTKKIVSAGPSFTAKRSSPTLNASRKFSIILSLCFPVYSLVWDVGIRKHFDTHYRGLFYGGKKAFTLLVLPHTPCQVKWDDLMCNTVRVANGVGEWVHRLSPSRGGGWGGAVKVIETLAFLGSLRRDGDLSSSPSCTAELCKHLLKTLCSFSQHAQWSRVCIYTFLSAGLCQDPDGGLKKLSG